MCDTLLDQAQLGLYEFQQGKYFKLDIYILVIAIP